MATRLVCLGYDAKMGFTLGDWTVLKAAAVDNNTVLFFRSGKEAALPWIEKRFPPKPLTLKVKVDREIGLLLAKDPSDKADVGRAGHWVLRKSSRSIGGAFEAYNPSSPRDAVVSIDDDWAREDLVVHSQSRLPITSDYDLAAIVPQSGPYRFLPAGMTAGKAAAPGSLERPAAAGKAGLTEEILKKKLAEISDPRFGFSNPWVDQMTAELNRRLGDQRLMHGPQALYAPPQMSNSKGPALFDAQLANGSNETLIAFCPDNTVHLWYCSTPQSSRGILPQYLPTFSG
jgi:hypothetical protein